MPPELFIPHASFLGVWELCCNGKKCKIWLQNFQSHQHHLPALRPEHTYRTFLRIFLCKMGFMELLFKPDKKKRVELDKVLV